MGSAGLSDESGISAGQEGGPAFEVGQLYVGVTEGLGPIVLSSRQPSWVVHWPLGRAQTCAQDLTPCDMVTSTKFHRSSVDARSPLWFSPDCPQVRSAGSCHCSTCPHCLRCSRSHLPAILTLNLGLSWKMSHLLLGWQREGNGRILLMFSSGHHKNRVPSAGIPISLN